MVTPDQVKQFRFRKPLRVFPHRVDRVGVLGPLVGPVALHPREAQGEAGGIVRARLDAVEGDLDDAVPIGSIGSSGQLRQPLDRRGCRVAVRIAGARRGDGDVDGNGNGASRRSVKPVRTVHRPRPARAACTA